MARCSVRAELREDPMLGTAFPAARILLVEQSGPWGRDGLAHSHFDPTVAQQLTDRFDRHGIRILSIRRPGRSGEHHARKWALADCRLGREHMVWGTFESDAELLSLPLEVPPAQGLTDLTALTDPGDSVFLVCTHGSHDACCALRGRPVAAALAELRPDRVWECSHVGGDRFAANVLVLPSGMLYGSVHVQESGDLVRAAEQGETLPGPLRGKVGLLPEAQAALAHAQQRWPGPARSVRIRSLEAVDSSLVQVRISLERGGTVHMADVLVRIGRSAVHRLTCQMTTPATVFTYHVESFSER